MKLSSPSWPGLPSGPRLPSCPGIPCAPALPSVPFAPAGPGLPAGPCRPGCPSTPGCPSGPGLPASPCLPAGPGGPGGPSTVLPEHDTRAHGADAARAERSGAAHRIDPKRSRTDGQRNPRQLPDYIDGWGWGCRLTRLLRIPCGPSRPGSPGLPTAPGLPAVPTFESTRLQNKPRTSRLAQREILRSPKPNAKSSQSKAST